MQNNKENQKSIIIIGAGPVGSLWGCYLAQRGHRVRIYEAREDMRLANVDVGKSINLALSDRGFKALSLIGAADLIRETAIPMRGRMIHVAGQDECSLQPYGLHDQAIYSVSRGGLNAQLMTLAEQEDNLQIFFSEKAVHVDLQQTTVRLLDKTGEQHTESADYIFAADGVFSAVRRSMMRTERYDYSQEWLSHGYKELHIPAGSKGLFRLEKNALHIWPRGSFMLIALPNLDGSFTCTLFLPFKSHNEDDTFCFDRLDSPKAIKTFFKDIFPDVIDLMPTIIDDFAENPSSSLGIIRCAPWTINKTCLMGDAAHAIVPFYGQGLNAGFEDCSVLADLLAQTDGSEQEWMSALMRFSREHKKNGDAIADLALYNFIEMRDRVLDPLFVLQKRIEKKLQKQYPEEYLPLYSLVTFSHRPYSEAKKYGDAQEQLLQDILQIEDVALFEQSEKVWKLIEVEVESYLKLRNPC